ncbi:molybdopterin molybdotransferase MoeA [Nitrogeniibacter mangrovi]|uniref:Molybdopterin molybdenumtransferase n=1 Tax=Nitrogeniibacter mangrovi TaxID=2016596 RepID=A0A6C1B7B1_9RHOO|nr:gephyrin-like molybdotransferase Glp [Nitrogeniibacter mangrovi]QID18618.1 molybdopterin molybdotransferase MoeA [Nitrogeniibacter mangrovi]
MSTSTQPAVAASRTALSVDEARQSIHSALTPIRGWERVAIRDALGRILADDVIAPHNVPAHDNSAMDGYAVRSNDAAAPGTTALKIVGTAFAGTAFSGQVGSAQAVRIMTGAMIPHGADCVVPQEFVQVEGETVTVTGPLKPGQNLRRAGEDLAKDAPALSAGTRVGPAELGLIASLGVAEVTVRRRLRVAFFSTGDEVASIGKPLAPGQIYDSNRYTLFGVLTRLGCELIDMGVIPDRPEALETAFADAAASADVILTSGGVSVGEADFIKDMMARMGEVDFWKLNIKPGRPMAFGRIGTTWLFGLPGNPVAVMVTFYQFVQDALLTLMGVEPLPERPTHPARCLADIRKMPGRREYVRAIFRQENGEATVQPTGAQGSGVLRSMSDANCFIVLPESRESVTAGETVEVQMFDGLI